MLFAAALADSRGILSMVQIRSLHKLQDMYPAVELQKVYWGDEIDSLVPAHMLFTIAASGGHVLAALDRERMVGVLIGLIGTNVEESNRPAMANLLVASKRMVVLPEYRGRGIGYSLKLAQREAAVKQGIRLVTWTFDPLMAANAHLNLRKLGCISQKYLINYYGTEDISGMVALGSSDRLVADWWVTSRRIEERINGQRGSIGLAHYLDANTVIVNPTVERSSLPYPVDNLNAPPGAFALLEIPADYRTVIEQDTALAIAWREHSRAAFQYLIGHGYIVTDFLREQYEDRQRAFYLLSYNSGFSLNLN
jgi:predicted GNAT superfamily acetyltransferase